MNTRSPIFLSIFVIGNVSIGLFFYYLWSGRVEPVIKTAAVIAVVGLVVVSIAWLRHRKQSS